MYIVLLYEKDFASSTSKHKYQGDYLVVGRNTSINFLNDYINLCSEAGWGCRSWVFRPLVYMRGNFC